MTEVPENSDLSVRAHQGAQLDPQHRMLRQRCLQRKRCPATPRSIAHPTVAGTTWKHAAERNQRGINQIVESRGVQHLRPSEAS